MPIGNPWKFIFKRFNRGRLLGGFGLFRFAGSKINNRHGKQNSEQGSDKYFHKSKG
jgi:hypothetical protein